MPHHTEDLEGSFAWVLNLDAEEELAALAAGRRYSRSQHLERIVAREAPRLVHELLGSGDVLVREGEPVPEGMRGMAWSPTPDALRRLEAAGASPAAAAPLDVVTEVNARPFATELRASWEHQSFDKHVVLDLEGALERLALPAPAGWLVRRTFGAAGRGRRRLNPGPPDGAELAWLRAGLERGPLVIEPWVHVLREYTRSGLVTPAGEVRLHAPCIQITTQQGAWVESEPGLVEELGRSDDARLEEAATAAGTALASAGYHGPFGIDAYRHERHDGAGTVLNPLSEINARFTMDWARTRP